MPTERPIANRTRTISDARSKRFRPRSEASRVQNTLIFLQAWRHVYRPGAAFDITPFREEANEQRPVPQVCPDSTLLSFAQLATWRLDARRAFVSLVDSDRQYILAEASKSMAFQHNNVKSPDDAASFGTCSLPRPDLLVTQINAWQAARSIREPPAEEDHYYTEGLSPHMYVLSDVRHHPVYRIQFAQHIPWCRFYCGVPIRSARGSVIGSLFIIDDRPRYGISEDQITFLEDISDTIAQHLHTTVASLQRQRSERLIQALSLFNSGKSSLREWWLSEEDNRVLNTGRLAEISDDMITPALRKAKMDAEFGARRDSPEHAHSEIPSKLQDPAPGTRNEASSSPSSPLITASEGKAATQPSRLRPRQRASVTFAEKRDLDPAKAYEQAYSRASNLMREALGMHAVTFLDAKFVNTTLKRTESEDSEKSYDTADSTSQDHEMSGTEEPNSKLCKILGCSVRSEDGRSNDNTKSREINMPETLLRSVIKRYPTGRVFNYTVDSELCTSSEEENVSASDEESTSKRWRRRVRSDGQRLLRAMPGARKIALFPLWNNAHGSWRSCAILYDTSIAITTESSDTLLNLSAFGHSLSAELSRLDTLMADRAKETFISSISHELRSPLHGVLAGVEFLQDSRLTGFQQEMAHTIAMAGRTLLDTVNHLLDYAKISNFTSQQMRERQLADASRHKAALVANINEIGVTANIDLANLTEELTETVVSAYRFESFPEPSSRVQTASSSSSRGPKPELQRQSSLSNSNSEGVSVLLNIAWRENWTVEMQPGSWTRIVTNLVGNALKYTPRGTISVRLEAFEEDEDTDEGLTPIRLVIEDTGNGISESYLANDLFTPFKQEDSHTTGTGLGLNIVKQIADSLGANLSFQSEVGKGTKVTLTFQGKFTEPTLSKRRSISDKPTTDENWDVGIDRLTLIAPTLNRERPEKAQINVVGQSVLRTAKEWLKCQALPVPDFDFGGGSTISAITEEDLHFLAESRPNLFSAVPDRVAREGVILLVLGSSTQALSLREQALPQGVRPLFIRQPIGPRKLLRAIATHTGPSTPFEAPSRENLDFSMDRPQSSSMSIASRQDRNIMDESADTITPAREPRPNPRRQSSIPIIANTAESTELLASTSSLSPEPVVPTTAQERPNSSTLDTVLLVEDNGVNMKLLVALMKKLSIKYKCASNGREALDIYRTMPQRIFLILMDMSMPVMDGYTSTTKIRETARVRRIPQATIVALTGVTNAEAKQRAFESGVDEYQTKPIHMKALKKLIDWAQTRAES